MNLYGIYTLPVGQMAANCYLLYEQKSKKAVVIDPGDDVEYIGSMLDKYRLTPERIVATHGHFDHIMGAFALSAHWNIPFFIHKDDEFLLSRMSESAMHFLGVRTVDPAPVVGGYVKDGDVIPVGEHLKLTVRHVPGHTPGSVALVLSGSPVCFVGDVIFAEGLTGRTDFSYSDKTLMRQSVNLLLSLPETTVLYPGHAETTTVSDEKRFHIPISSK